jgi:hypothetical protein
MISDKIKNKLKADGVQLDFDKINTDSITRNTLKSVKRQANLRHGGHQLANELSFGRSNNLGDANAALNGAHHEPQVDFSETAQEIKIRKAAEKRARRAMK